MTTAKRLTTNVPLPSYMKKKYLTPEEVEEVYSIPVSKLQRMRMFNTGQTSDATNTEAFSIRSKPSSAGSSNCLLAADRDQAQALPRNKNYPQPTRE
jgi:hypothetical protein